MIILDYWYVKIDIVITRTNKPSCLSNGSSALLDETFF